MAQVFEVQDGVVGGCGVAYLLQDVASRNAREWSDADLIIMCGELSMWKMAAECHKERVG